MHRLVEGTSPGRDAAGNGPIAHPPPVGQVVRRPTLPRAFGHDALHVQLQINDHCPLDEYYRLAETHSGPRGISYADKPRLVDINLWIVDVDGTTVVVDMWHHVDTPSVMLEAARLTRRSIRFETLEQGNR